jgi:pimeloyl-ACP methyl ester carboxylesterase
MSTLVLVHGAWHGGWCWRHLATLLRAAGHQVHNPTLTGLGERSHLRTPLETGVGLDTHIQDVANVLEYEDLRDVVLVGHSYAGMVISEAGVDPKVAGLVYVAARAPDAGEDYPALTKKFPTAPASLGLTHAGGFAQLSEAAFLRDFANGVDPVRARALYAVQGPIADTLFDSRTTQAAWRSKPSFYAVSRNDRTTNPDLERFLARRMKATTIELDSGHLSLVTHPREIAGLILRAARGGAA